MPRRPRRCGSGASRSGGPGISRATRGTIGCPTFPGWSRPPAQTEHPDYFPAADAEYIAQKLDAIVSNPDVWTKTAFILCYDENDGLFDHVPPPSPAAGTPDEFVQGEPIGLGFRTPTTIVSPWTAGGFVCSDVFDHT
jgi:phospholipase C